MNSSFYTNYSEIKFIDKLKKNIDTCKAFYFSVSFIKKPGLRLLAPNIEAAVARGACGRLITSTYQNFTDVDSLQFFYDLQTRYDYYFPADGSDELLLVEKWRDAEALALHGQEPHFARIGALKPQYVTDTLIERFESCRL